ncbi:MAG: hypothetical protein K0S70_1431, partial [Microbacterium sp.]|nr:hypothetical protein [Microbacterium sp.]
ADRDEGPGAGRLDERLRVEPGDESDGVHCVPVEEGGRLIKGTAEKPRSRAEGGT